MLSVGCMCRRCVKHVKLKQKIEGKTEDWHWQARVTENFSMRRLLSGTAPIAAVWRWWVTAACCDLSNQPIRSEAPDRVSDTTVNTGRPRHRCLRCFCTACISMSVLNNLPDDICRSPLLDKHLSSHFCSSLVLFSETLFDSVHRLLMACHAYILIFNDLHTWQLRIGFLHYSLHLYYIMYRVYYWWLKTGFSARQHICIARYAIARPPVRLSVFPSHGWISQKRLKLLQNIHCTLDPSV